MSLKIKRRNIIMATLTTTDFTNASKYATHQHRLRYIPRWRSRLPHILIDYEIRPATNDDYYVPPKLANSAIAVKLKFSKRGCESMNCYPFHETGTIDLNTPFGYTQTSETAVAYAQPACYNLNRAAATREGAENEVQSVELRYTDDNKCIMVDSVSKMYLNTPYLRTDEHLIKGVDDVPGFNVNANDDPLYPEMYRGTFNEAYCRRFGRTLTNGGCSLQWWESLIGFVLGDTIYITFKLLARNVFSELRSFDYTHPSPLLPAKPTVDSKAILMTWQNVRDTQVDFNFEKKFQTYETLNDLGIENNTKLSYVAEKGFSRSSLPRERLLEPRQANIDANETGHSLNENDLEAIISQFLEDHALLLGIATDIGLDLLMTQLKNLLRKINSTLIPALKRMLLVTSKRVTVKMLGETYKAAVVHQLNRIAIKTISSVAKAITKVTVLASSVVGILLIILTLSDLVLALWDPFGYSNMFPRQFPDDLSTSFLGAFFESMNESHDMIEFMPEFFEDLIEDDDANTLDSLIYILDYVSALEINSNGQLLNFEQSPPIDDFDEATLVGAAISSSFMYTKLEFMQYTKRHNEALGLPLIPTESSTMNVVVAFLWILSAFMMFPLQSHFTNISALFLLFLLLALYSIVKESAAYYVRMRKYIETDKDNNVPWWRNLYD